MATNVKVNQNCLNISDPDLQGRGQAQNETWVAVDPNNPTHLVASYNDYRRGDGTCGVSYSLNGGTHLGGHDHPERVHPRRLVRHRPRSTGRPAATPPSPGTPGATPTCPARCSTAAAARRPNPDQSSAFYVYRSTGTDGASFNFPGRPVADAQRHRRRRQLPAGQAAADRRQPRRQPVPRTGSTSPGRRSPRTAPATSTRRYSSDYGETLQRARPGQRRQRAVRQHVRPADPAGQLQREPVLPAVHRARRHAVRRVRQLQQRGHRHGQPQPGAAGQVDRRRRDLLRPGQGRRLLRAARLRHLPGRRRRPGPRLRAGEGRRRPTRSSGRRNYPIGAVDPTDPNRVVVTFGSYINRNSNETQRLHPAGFAADGINTLHRRQDRRLQQRHRATASPPTAALASPAPPPTRDSCRSSTDGARPGQHRPVLAGRRVHPRRDARGRPTTTGSTATTTTTGYSDITVSASHDRSTSRARRATSSSHAAADPVRRPVLRRLRRHRRSPARPPTRSGPTPAPSTCSSAPAPDTTGNPPTRLHRLGAQRAVANDQDIYTAGVPIP